MPAVETEPFLSRPLNEIPSAPSTYFTVRSEIEATHSAMGSGNASIQPVASLLLELVLQAAFLGDANQWFSELKGELHFVRNDNMG